jgi:hypothetical protein
LIYLNHGDSCVFPFHSLHPKAHPFSSIFEQLFPFIV